MKMYLKIFSKSSLHELLLRKNLEFINPKEHTKLTSSQTTQRPPRKQKGKKTKSSK